MSARPMHFPSPMYSTRRDVFPTRPSKAAARSRSHCVRRMAIMSSDVIYARQYVPGTKVARASRRATRSGCVRGSHRVPNGWRRPWNGFCPWMRTLLRGRRTGVRCGGRVCEDCFATPWWQRATPGIRGFDPRSSRMPRARTRCCVNMRTGRSNAWPQGVARAGRLASSRAVWAERSSFEEPSS